MNLHEFNPDSIDALIAKRLPAWMRTAAIDRLQALHRALRAQQKSAEKMRELLAQVPALDAYAEPLLKQALLSRFKVDTDVRASSVRIVQDVFYPVLLNSAPKLRYRHTSNRKLLAAALHNYAEDETRVGALTEAKLLDVHKKPLGISFSQFAQLCRSLDLGGSYQKLLKGHLQPEESAARAEVQAQIEEDLRARMEVAVRRAVLEGQIDERSYLQLLPFCSPQPIVPGDAAVLTCQQLRVLGKPVEGVATLEVREQAAGALTGVISWIPDDPVQPVQRHGSWAALYQTLAERFRQKSYVAFFMRFVRERDRPSFSNALNKRLKAADGTTVIELDGRHTDISGTLVAYLRQLRIEKTLDDARVLAVPTGDEDSESRRERFDGYVEAGLTLLTLAGLFVPVIGQAMLGVAAAQIANEVYEGYEDWTLGDRQAALKHLFGVAENVAVGTLLAAGGVAVGKVLERVSLLDDLAPIVTEAGHTKLCRESLEHYWIDDEDLPIGQKHEAGGAWRLRLDSGSYQLADDQASGAMRLAHPRRGSAYAPLIEDNGAGGWRTSLDRPHEWAGSGLLMRRLGAELDALSDDQAERIAEITGFDEGKLRQLHLEHAPPPARLLDAWERYQLHEEFPALRDEDFESEVKSRQAADEPEAQLLKRDFPGLSSRGAREIVGQANGQQLKDMLEKQRVPLSLAEQARWFLRDSRLDRACAGLRQASATNQDTERLALGLIDELAPWSGALRLEIREGSGIGAVRAQRGNEAATGRDLRRIVRGPQGYQVQDGRGAPLALASERDSLAQALLQTLEPSQKVLLGDALLDADGLTDKLARAASAERDQVAKLIGLAPVGDGMRPPTRFADGRLGYPLSQRVTSSRQASRLGIRQIYPTLGEDQLENYMLDLLARHVDPWVHYNQLRRQLTRLRETLQAWRSANHGILDSLRRQRVVTALRRSWRRKSSILGDGGYWLMIRGEHVGSLPSLPTGVTYPHVTRLTLRDMALTTLDADFLARFPGLRELDLRHNTLTQVPAGIEQLITLRRLRLGHNQIVMDAAGNRRLQALVNLQELDLSRNPLGYAPDVDGLRHLRHLSLNATGLTEMPERVQQLPWQGLADLRNNSIRQVRQELHSLQLRLQRMVLHDNPLDQASQSLVRQASRDPLGHRVGHQLIDRAARERWLTGSSGVVRSRREAQWLRLREDPESRPLFQFFADFAETLDFQDNAAYYRDRIWRMINACDQNTELRTLMYTQAGGERTCEDRLLLILSELEVTMYIERMAGGKRLVEREDALLSAGRALYRLDEVNAIAARQVQVLEQRRGRVDPIEVYLAYRTRLAVPLGLPAQPEDMHYMLDARVTAADLNTARLQILRDETPEKLSAALAQRPFWDRYVHARYPEQVDALVASFDEQLTQAALLSEQLYLVRSEALRGKYEAALQALRLKLAQEAYARILRLAPVSDA
ncbi:NEL-type E3 ubiquitin ligase domain-containing protein [Pseudomonas entomophila]|uniref:NEL-type E3 ubiquitin ligase domain-containing protein n=1 Tax=Pseudomonas entomophila TaxID=312306 RepID=UPI001F031340|nr:NEL-type E3 ubiquitin ligase domain-containing protein [Pseudomonas entomophila]MCG8293475.1 hypothetical protein [Pseudomonas entomophila]